MAMTTMRIVSSAVDCNVSSKRCPSLRTLTDRRHRAHRVRCHGLCFFSDLKLSLGEGYVLGGDDVPESMRNGHLWAVVATEPAEMIMICCFVQRR